MESKRPSTLLILGSFAEGALEHRYVEGLSKLGWAVHCFDIQRPVNFLKNRSLADKILYNLSPSVYTLRVNEAVLQKAEAVKPIAILVFKGMELYPSTIMQLRNYCKVIGNYNADHPFKFFSTGSGNKNIERSIKYYDIYFSYSKNICTQLSLKYKVTSFCIPFGYDKKTNFRQCRNNYFEQNFVFIGAWDKERQKQIMALSEQPVKVYGPDLWTKKNFRRPSMKTIIAGYPLYNEQYAHACKNSLGIINFLRKQNLVEGSHNMRTFEVPGYGGLLIANRTQEQLEFFEEDKEAVYFGNLQELEDKLTFLSARKSLVETLKSQALLRARKSNYSYSHRTKQLSDILKSTI